MAVIGTIDGSAGIAIELEQKLPNGARSERQFDVSV
jgi:hypothetical protein